MIIVIGTIVCVCGGMMYDDRVRIMNKKTYETENDNSRNGADNSRDNDINIIARGRGRFEAFVRDC